MAHRRRRIELRRWSPDGPRRRARSAARCARRVARLRPRHSTSATSARPAPAGRSSIDLDDNEVFENTAGNGQGIRFLNSTADGASIAATLHRNRSHDNNVGFLAATLGSSHASITIPLDRRPLRGKLIGGVIFGGLTRRRERPAATR
jgi:hypothetical protein